ncbi:Na+/H+ antiporter NhaA [Streptomyces sp. NPDC048254]|uniref:Na+/H+ antiporter NhaA n=1 Tax=Streptomyces sp. NPDC048254 TaxID=3365525 RepID=UPI003723A4C8
MPIVAALGATLVQAAVFLAANATTSGEELGGWGIPMVTDPAFAVAILAVVGRHLPARCARFC